MNLISKSWVIFALQSILKGHHLTKYTKKEGGYIYKMSL